MIQLYGEKDLECDPARHEPSPRGDGIEITPE